MARVSIILVRSFINKSFYR